MVLSIKAAAPADYYWQATGLESQREFAECQWLSGARTLGIRTDLKALENAKSPPYCTDRETLHALLHRRTADDGRKALFNRIEGMRGHDFVFSAPKSVSLVWAFSNKDQRGLIEQAHHQAVCAAADIIKRYIVKERVGKGGQELFPARCAIAAFMHVLGRPAVHREGPQEAFPDPNLHSHLVIPDLVLSDIKSPGTRKPVLKIAYTTLYARWAMALGAWYHAALAHGLHTIGLRLEPSGDNGLFQVSGVAPVWISAFSARSQGADGRRSFLGRKNARTTMPPDAIENLWRAHAGRLGMPGTGLFDHCARKPIQGSPPTQTPVKSATLASIITALGQESAVLQLQDLFRGVAAGLVERRLFAMPTVEHIDEMTGMEQLVEIAHTTSYRLPQWTTRNNQETEAEVQELAQELSSNTAPAVPIGAQLHGTFLNQEQTATARAIAERDGSLSIVCGPAGSGKTTLLEPVVRAFEAKHGRGSVIGVSMAWMQALQLAEKFDIEAFSIASLLAAKQAKPERFDKVRLVVLDEAGLLPSARMADLLRFVTRHRMKIVMVGDLNQLDPIGAGSGLRLVLQKADPARQHGLVEVKRQTDPSVAQIMRELIALSSMPMAKAFDTKVWAAAEGLADKILTHDRWQSRLSSSDAAEDVAQMLLSSLMSADKPLRALMRSHRQAQHVTRILRGKLRKLYRIEGDDLALPARTPMGGRYILKIAKGDHIRFLQRRKDLKVYNGTEAAVTDISGTGASARITVKLSADTVSDMPKGSTFSFTIDEIACKTTGLAMLSCAYAVTIFGSQGATYDDVVILKSMDMKFRELFVALTRCRSSFHIVDVDWRKCALSNSHEAMTKAIAKDIFTAKARERKALLAGDYVTAINAAPPKPWDMHIRCRDPLPKLVPFYERAG